MKVRPSVAIVEGNNVLLMRYRYGDADVFNLPGGNTDPGETLVQTLQRELQEELGIEIAVQQLLLTGEVILPQQKTDVLHCVFLAKISSGIPVLNPAETSSLEVLWKNIDELADLEMYPNVGTMLQKQFKAIQDTSCYVGQIPQRWH
ncbi:MAG: NUDIX hydrolase [Spirosomataceae bacterium]|jgi:8-oxo-dGTP diphosphatase|nr:NUDIX hydrolase [Flectobacillus sp.]